MQTVKSAPMTPEDTNAAEAAVSIAIFAWNEEATIAHALNSLFRQTLFAELASRNRQAEVACVANGCSDRTAAVAEAEFARQRAEHPHRRSFRCLVLNVPERGKLNAWNRFVHDGSAPSAEFFILMDADIDIHRRETLWNMLSTLARDPEASVTVDRPVKDIVYKQPKSLRDRLSLAASGNTQSATAQLCAQLYCIRAGIARNIYLPRDLSACEDGFIKTMVCTDFLTHESLPKRIRLAEGAEHTFEAYTSLASLVKNQKRQVIGQTIVHVLVDKYLPGLSVTARQRLAETIREKEQADPDWLKLLIQQHLAEMRFFWRLYPGVLGLRLQRWKKLPRSQKVPALASALAGSVLAVISAWLGFAALKQGCTDYWPRAERGGFRAPRPHSIPG
jgi:glycosyltransferase involved in cell wall biosynthesis